jgi:hypothetical protein
MSNSSKINRVDDLVMAIFFIPSQNGITVTYPAVRILLSRSHWTAHPNNRKTASRSGMHPLLTNALPGVYFVLSAGSLVFVDRL